MKWVYLSMAILLEVLGTSAMKLSNGFSQPFYALIMFPAYIGSLVMLTLALKKLEISTAYSLWSGLGIAIIALIGIFFLGEKITLLKTISLILLLLGVIGLQLGEV